MAKITDSARRRAWRGVALGYSLGVFAPEPVRAQSSGADATDAERARATADDVHLADDVIDPTAPLMQLNLMYEWTIDHHGSAPGATEDDAHSLELRPVIPLRAFGLQHIFRLSIAYELDTATDAEGLGAVQAFDLVVFEQPWGRWGAGAVVNLEPEGDPDAVPGAEADHFQLGPAIGVVVSPGKWTLGVFNQNFFSDEVQVSILQPIIGYGISPTLSVSTGDLELAWDWSEGAFTRLPIGVQLNLVIAPLGQPVRLFVNPQINLMDEAGSERWSAIVGFAVLALR